MKTIELKDKMTLAKCLILMTYLYKEILKEDQNFHYLFEPQLIIRTAKHRAVTKYLRQSEIKYKVYDYPYPKRGFGESKKRKRIQGILEVILHVQSVCTLTLNQKEDGFINNRLHHCFLNMHGYQYYDEAKYYLNQAQSYMYHDYKESGKWSTLVSQKILWSLAKIL